MADIEEKKDIIVAIETYFEENKNLIPKEPLVLSKCETITDMNKFIESHILAIKVSKDDRNAQLCIDRLKKLKNIMEGNKNENNN